MFQVAWLREAVDELADIWIKADSPSRKAITQATHILDQGNISCRGVFWKDMRIRTSFPWHRFPVRILQTIG